MKRRADRRLSLPVRAFMGCGGLLFALFGLLPAWALVVPPGLELQRSWSWPAARCEVLYVGVEQVGGEYRPLVAFAYQAGGRERVSARFEVLPNEYKTEEKARAQAAGLTAGQRTECYVSAAGEQAVLKRRPNVDLLLGLTPLLFLLPAAPFLWLALRSTPAQALSGEAGTWLPRGLAPEQVSAPGSPVTLAPASTPLGRFVGLLIATVVWNGITGVFMVLAWQESSWRDLGAGALCFAPFPLIGLLLLGAVVQRFFALFGPRAHLTLSQTALRPGDSVAVAWELRRMAWRVRSTKVALVGREVVPTGGDGAGPAPPYVFLEHELDQALPGGSPTAGRAGLTIPAGLMHSFEAGAFKLEWLVRVRAKVLLAPDLEEEYPLLVLPERSRR